MRGAQESILIFPQNCLDNGGHHTNYPNRNCLGCPYVETYVPLHWPTFKVDASDNVWLSEMERTGWNMHFVLFTHQLFENEIMIFETSF